MLSLYIYCNRCTITVLLLTSLYEYHQQLQQQQEKEHEQRSSWTSEGRTSWTSDFDLLDFDLLDHAASIPSSSSGNALFYFLFCRIFLTLFF